MNCIALRTLPAPGLAYPSPTERAVSGTIASLQGALPAEAIALVSLAVTYL